MNNKSDLKIFTRMLKELGKLTPIMLLTILFGVGGYIAAASIGVFATLAAASLLEQGIIISMSTAVIVIVVSAVLRGVLRYAEQLSGHYIAFRILAILRDKIFNKLRKLAPAKLDTKEKGNIVSIITSDIELMEVFYAHTIAPVMIAICTSIIYTIVLSYIHIALGVLGGCMYILLGFVLPIVLKNRAASDAGNYRKHLGKNSAYLLDALRGLKEILFFGTGTATKDTINKNTHEMGSSAKAVKKREGLGYAITDLLIIISMFGCLVHGYNLLTMDEISAPQLIIALVLLVSSFGPVVALSALSTTLAGTVASARRVFDLLDEPPAVYDVLGTQQVKDTDIIYHNVSFKYESREAQILRNINTHIDSKQSVAINGSSGCGKSTMLKLLMRFYDISAGSLQIGNDAINSIPTTSLRKAQAFVEQDTFLFNDTIENNIRLENNQATMEQIVDAAKKAAIHNMIVTLPNGYQTNVGELGGRLSSGEKQRIALARAFLRDSHILLLDEPTSNLDALSEAEILKSIKTHCTDQTVILVSHRESTTNICDRILKIENGCVVEEGS